MLRMSSRVASIFGENVFDYLSSVEPLFKDAIKGFKNINLIHLINVYNKYLGMNITKITTAEKDALIYLRHFFTEGSLQYHPDFKFYFKESFREMHGIVYNYIDTEKTSKEFLKNTVNSQKELDDLVGELDLLVARKMSSVMDSAYSRGLPFNLTKTDIKRLLLSKKCAYSGTPFEKEGDNVRTFDRKNTDLGYVKGNVVACTLHMNQLKEELFENRGMDFKTVFNMIKALDPTL